MTSQPWLTGPIAITGGNGHVGRALRRRLTGLPNLVRVLGRDDDWEQGVRDAAAVVHLAGALQPRRGDTYVGANVGTVERLLAALAKTTPRIVYLSYVGADRRETNAYLNTKGRAEELIRSSTKEPVIIRSTFVCGTPDDIGPSFVSSQVAPNRTVPASSEAAASGLLPSRSPTSPRSSLQLHSIPPPQLGPSTSVARPWSASMSSFCDQPGTGQNPAHRRSSRQDPRSGESSADPRTGGRPPTRQSPIRRPSRHRPTFRGHPDGPGNSLRAIQEQGRMRTTRLRLQNDTLTDQPSVRFHKGEIRDLPDPVRRTSIRLTITHCRIQRKADAR